MFCVSPLFWGEGERIFEIECRAGTLIVEDFRLTEEGGFVARLLGPYAATSDRFGHPSVAIAQLAGLAPVPPEDAGARLELLLGWMRVMTHTFTF